jgi:hypothetical protein
LTIRISLSKAIAEIRHYRNPGIAQAILSGISGISGNANAIEGI